MAWVAEWELWEVCQEHSKCQELQEVEQEHQALILLQTPHTHNQQVHKPIQWLAWEVCQAWAWEALVEWEA